MSDTPRTWIRGANGLWSSREPNKKDERRHTLYQQWKQKKITFGEMSKEIDKKNLYPEP